MTRIGLATPRSHQIKTLPQALAVLDDIGLPAIIRPSFTMGGTGGGIAYNKAEYIEIVERGIDASPTSEVLVEESVLGWKEFEMEDVRDKADNCIIAGLAHGQHRPSRGFLRRAQGGRRRHMPG